MLTWKQFLQEKLIILGNGAHYGQIVVMAGGAGSGKSYVVHNFLEAEKYKIIDIDEWKKSFVKLKLYPEWQEYDPHDPKKVAKLQLWIMRHKVRDRILDMLFKDPTRNRQVLPNVLFDISLASYRQLEEIVDLAVEGGYNPDNIHLVYVITDWEIALNRNRGRERVLDDGVVLKTLTQAAGTFMKMLQEGFPPGFNGAVKLVMTHGKEPEYITVKKEGGHILSEKGVVDIVRETIEKFTGGMPPKLEKKPDAET